jgi:hypothetical protein
METFVELLMLKKEDHLYFSLSVVLFEILANDPYVLFLAIMAIYFH